MNGLTRRQLLQRLAGCVAVGGTVVLAEAVLAEEAEAASPPPAAPDERAEGLAEGSPPDGVECSAFLNRAFRNGGGIGVGGGGFRNGGFVNGGGFRNGGFVNGGGFRNSAFRNW